MLSVVHVIAPQHAVLARDLTAWGSSSCCCSAPKARGVAQAMPRYGQRNDQRLHRAARARVLRLQLVLRVQQGYGGLLHKLQRSLNVRLRHTVTRVARTASGVRVEVKRPDGGAMALEADLAICSLPLGVLKCQ